MLTTLQIEREQRATTEEQGKSPGHSRARSKSTSTKPGRPSTQRAVSSQLSHYTQVRDEGQTTSPLASPAPTDRHRQLGHLAPPGQEPQENGSSAEQASKVQKVVEEGVIKSEPVDEADRPAPARFVTASEF